MRRDGDEPSALNNLDGVLAEGIREPRRRHPPRLRTRSGSPAASDARYRPGSSSSATQRFLQPPKKTTDVVSIIKGVIAAELGAIEHYNRLIKECDGVDYVTQDMVITILTDEEEHLREFEGFLKENEGRRARPARARVVTSR
jgi:bacterioferritin